MSLNKFCNPIKIRLELLSKYKNNAQILFILPLPLVFNSTFKCTIDISAYSLKKRYLLLSETLKEFLIVTKYIFFKECIQLILLLELSAFLVIFFTRFPVLGA